MQKILERLKEAQTALDSQLYESFFTVGQGDQRRFIGQLWKAKQNIWWAQMQTLDAFQGHIPEPEI